jgi:hypothetical protein
MRTRELANEELDKIVKLRQIGTSWLKIQHETGIDRRKAKRAYEKWERAKSTDELKKARQDVAAQAFGEHINSLIKFAESLVGVLGIPRPLWALCNADEVLDRFWTTYMLEQEYSSTSESVSHGTEHVAWRNKMLFKSLQEHTQGKVRWQALEEWKEARNNAVKHSGELRTEATEIVANLLDNKPDLKHRVTTAIAGVDVIKEISNGLMEAMWRGMLTGNQEQIYIMKGASAITEGQVWVEFCKGDSETRLFLNDVKLAKEALSICRWADDNLRKGLKSGLVQKLTDDVCQMQDRIKELEESLDELLLRPMILLTRCDLCPA